jgi:hypothetical protein
MSAETAILHLSSQVEMNNRNKCTLKIILVEGYGV